MKLIFLPLLLTGLATFYEAAAAEVDIQDHLQVGLQPDGRIVVPTNQILHAAGVQVTFAGRPVDLAFSEDGRTLIVKNMGDLVLIDIASQKVTGVLPVAKKQIGETPEMGKIFTGMSVTGLVVTGDRVMATSSKDQVLVADTQADGTFKWGKSVLIPKASVGGDPHPAGLCLTADGSLWVTATRGNCVHRIDPATGKIDVTVATGIAPFGLAAPLPNKVYVSNWGGNPPTETDPQAPSSKSMVRVDRRTSVADDGTVSVVMQKDGKWAQVKTIAVGLHPSGMIASQGGRLVYVANANSDTVSVIDTATDTVVETIPCRPEGRLPFGSGTNALALSPDGGTLYAANGTNNCLAVVALGAKAVEKPAAGASESSHVRGLIPTGWYPGAVLVSRDGKKLFVANIKGHGAVAVRRDKKEGKSGGDYLGSISIIDAPNDQALAAYTAEVNANNRLAFSMAGLDQPRPEAKPVPVPERHGEPSVFKHVLYVIKENKTYDQVFGDMAEGDGDANLCIFGEEITPNAHALAREFTLFDNFYCSGSKSPDGHSWVNEAYVTDYLEKSFGGFSRSYPYEGSDPLAFAATGFLWDNVLAHGKTLRNYGEFCKTTYEPSKAAWKDLYADYLNGTQNVKIKVEPNMQSLAPYTHPMWGGFPLKTPDVYHAKMFRDEMAAFEKSASTPNLLYVFLPADHTSGTGPGNPTPRAMVADNDQALGEIVEAVTKSSFWRETCIFVVQDDPQSGYDHVDGHRTVALAISPHTRRKFVDHTNYNQTGMVKTIELMLGLPPMNQLDLSATAMRQCFQPEADLTPYAARKARIPLDEMNPPVEKLKGAARKWAEKSVALSFDKEDQADDNTFNRILWHAMRGDQPYPERFVKYAGEKDDEDDD
jgi:YVTN family beta-propeller protein